MKKLIALLACTVIVLNSFAQTFTKRQYQEDFQFFWQTINDNYCYFDKKQIDWPKLKPVYQAQLDTVNSRSGFVAVLERALYELYDHHIGLRTNTKKSRKLVPTNTDIWADYVNDKPLVTALRRGFGAEKVGIKVGMEITAINDIPAAEAIRPFLSHRVNNESKSFALRLALAGDHLSVRKLTLKDKGKDIVFYPDADSNMIAHITYPAMIEANTLPGNIGYIKINNCLFDNALIGKFDTALNSLMKTKAMIIDLRETPSGGNTSVARAILGRFITKDHFYQKHELYAEEKATGIKRSWAEIVSPRGPVYTGKLIVLVNHWTGSVAEGITIAFDGMKRATVIGTPMAGLNGAIEGFDLPNTKIGCNIATERLYHINGQPREFYRPQYMVDMSARKPGEDIILATALQQLGSK